MDREFVVARLWRKEEACTVEIEVLQGVDVSLVIAIFVCGLLRDAEGKKR